MARLLLASSSLTAAAPASLAEALARVEARLDAWAADTTAYNNLLLEVFAAAGTEPTLWQQAVADLQATLQANGLTIVLELLGNAELPGINGAYTAQAPGGGERIYLNGLWLQAATAAEIEEVLLEELGHAIDRRLNGSAESPGDEGERFSALIRGYEPTVASFTENDQRQISLKGHQLLVEASADTTTPRVDLSGFRNPAFAGSASAFGLPSVGAFATPDLADIDGDGDLDAFIGSLYGNTFFFRNTGSATSPAFARFSIGFGLPDVGRNASPAFADIDGDGDLDAFIGEQFGSTLFFRNTGSASRAAFAGSSIGFGLPDVGYIASPAFADIDGDGDLDAFIGNAYGSTLFFRNIGSATAPAFASSSIGFGLPNVGSFASPAFADIDGDGDLDAFIGNRFGSTLFFRNTGSATSPVFAGASIGFGLPDVRGFASPAFADIDGDGDLDAFIGEQFGSTPFFRNTGNDGLRATNPNGSYAAGSTITIAVAFSEVVFVTGTPTLLLETGSTDRAATYLSGSGTSLLSFSYTVQAGDTSADLDVANSSALVLNGGTIQDAAGNNALLTLPAPGATGSLGANNDLVIDGTAPRLDLSGFRNPAFAGSSIGFGLPDVGYLASPAFADIDGDGDLDAFIGNSAGSTLFFRNTGSASAPAFAGSASTFGLPDVGGFASPAFADIDGDGDLDAFIGNYDGNTLFFRNTGSATSAAFAGSASTFGLPDVGGFASPAFADIDGDGDLDAFIGNFSGSTLFFRNTGSATRPSFAAESFVFALPNVGLNASPAFADIDGDGDLDAFIGNRYGSTLFLRNIGSGLFANARFSIGFGLTEVGRSASPAFADIDGDGDLDAFIGNKEGSTLFFRNTGSGGLGTTNPDGRYSAGRTITIEVLFSEVVFVNTAGGTPTLLLETGSNDRAATYLSGSGTRVLRFSYTVQAGDTSADLDVTSSSALVLNGGTIKDAAGNSAVLTLPAPGAAGSLGANADLVIDGLAPTVAGVASSSSNGSYGVGSALTLTVQFSEAVVVNTAGGIPSLLLETGGTDRAATYLSGSGTNTLTFQYIVQAGDLSADLDITSSSALALNGATIRDAAGNNAVLTLPAPGAAGSLGANADLVIDGLAPTVAGVASSSSNGSYGVGSALTLTVQFSEAVVVNTAGGIPSLLLETGGTDRAATYLSGSGTNTLTFQYIVQAGDSSADLDITSSNALQLNSATIRDAAGNNAVLTLPVPGAAGSLGATAELVIDGVAPTASIVVADTALAAGETSLVTITFSEAVTGFTNDDFTIENGTLSSVSSIDGGLTYTATFTPAAGLTAASNTISLDNSGVSDLVGNPGTGSTTSNVYAIDTARPTATGVASNTPDGSYPSGAVITLTIRFSEAMIVNTIGGSPTLALETGSTDRLATFSGGSGTDTLNFSYTVQPGDTSADLDLLSTGALALNGGTIKDAAGNDAVLTLPAPGATGSLAANAALVIDGVGPTITAGPFAVGDASITIRSDANGSVALFTESNTRLFGTTLRANILGTFDLAAQASVTRATLKVADIAGNLTAAIPSFLLGTSGNDSITGTATADLLYGFAGNDTLNGAAGVDTLTGGDGNDTYSIETSGDLVVETNAVAATGGTDMVLSSLAAYTLTDNVEHLTLTGAAAINGTGNALNNVITGNAAANSLTGAGGNDSLNGGAGIDTLTGGDGSDTYTIETSGDLVVETNAVAATGGTDTVLSSLAAYTLTDNVEHLTLTGAAPINGTGNALNNRISGNAGANVLNGGDGIDTLTGGNGNDAYVIETAGDLVVETNAITAIGGIDRVVTSIANTTLTDNVENLFLTGAASNGTGNILNNTIAGNTGANSLDGAGGNDSLDGAGGNDSLNGGAGIDTLTGGDGSDTYTIETVGDLVVETNAVAATGGTDTVLSSLAAYTLTTNVENLTLTGAASINGTGNALNNVITGNAATNSLTGAGGNDSLNGGAGIDTLTGGDGSDTYTIETSGDLVVETNATAATGGTDTVLSSLASYILTNNVENLTLTGVASINGTGNTLNNRITGNAAANVLNGGAGIDTLSGGDGNDTYVIETVGDLIIETNANAATGGTDRVVTSLANTTLTDNFENLFLAGAAINGTGNILNNTIAGNAGANVLGGAGGNDSLIGGSGNDTLTGGLGTDTFRFDSPLNAATNRDRITDFSLVEGDRIELENTFFSTLPTTGTLAAAAFTTGAAATSTAHRILYNNATGQLTFDSDGNGAAAAIAFATLSPGLALTNTSFIVT
jgi:Ca2+-binding RTX toxin-like protein